MGIASDLLCLFEEDDGTPEGSFASRVSAVLRAVGRIASKEEEETFTQVLAGNDAQLVGILGHHVAATPAEETGSRAFADLLQLSELAMDVAPEKAPAAFAGSDGSLAVLAAIVRAHASDTGAVLRSGTRAMTQLTAALGLLGQLASRVALPAAQRDAVDESLVRAVFDLLGRPRDLAPNEDDGSGLDVLSTAMVNTLVCIHDQHLQAGCSPARNPVVVLLQSHESAGLFAEYLLTTINRAEELILPPALTLVEALFCFPPTADIFFTNDLRILLDVVLREATDLPETTRGEALRDQYLAVLLAVMAGETYQSKPYRKPEFLALLTELRARAVDADGETVSERLAIIDECLELMQT